MNMGANEFTLEELEELFKDTQPTTPAAEEDTTPQDGNDGADDDNNNKSNNVENTKAFANRLKQSTDKARKEEREAIAKSLGYESYEDMETKRKNKLLEDKGLDPTDVSPIVDELVKQKLESDPRMQELEEFRKYKRDEFAKRELAEVTKLTDGAITSLAQLPKEVINRWQELGSLRLAYLELEGENLIARAKGGQSKGSTSHMNSLNSNATPPPTKTRPLTAEEKQIWKIFNPGISDEELNKKTVNK